MRSLQLLLRTPALLSIFIALIALAVYVATLAPGLDFIDSGELATVATTLGIAHPTGYPLWTLIAHLVTRLPFPGAPIDRLNFMAAVLCAAGIGVFVRLMLFILTRLDPKGTTGDEARYAAAGAGLLLAFSETYWSQATAIEVYSLHVALVISVLFAFLRANATRAGLHWHLFAFVLALAFTNHMTTILLAPGFLYYYFAEQGFSRQSWKRILAITPAFLLGLSLYLYLPLRASRNPFMDWGNPVTLERFLWHWTGKQYRSWIFSSMEVAGKQFTYFLTSYPSEFVYIGGILAVIGAVRLWKLNRRLCLFTILLFVGCVAYSINYDIHDIDSYFLLAYIMTALWAGFGLTVIFRELFRKWPAAWRAPLLCTVVVAAIPVVSMYQRQDESKNFLVEDYTKNMFASFDSNAVVLSYQWDYWVSAAYYEQLVRGIRGDVVVIDKELLRRSWYFHQLAERYPWLVERSRKEIDAFLVELDKFEHDRPYNPVLIEARYSALLRSIIERSLPDHPVYVCPEIEPVYTGGFQRVPCGLAFRLYADTLFRGTPRPEFSYRPLDRSGRLEDQVRKMYADAFLSRGDYYYSRRKDRGEAAWSYESAYLFEPGAVLISERLQAVGRP